ncbi:hypothetical protein OY671_007532 [Metschnikowia pulcherrima]|nr:hypothetical protein OY671_007532 [Metschnikowia pulcherrima]
MLDPLDCHYSGREKACMDADLMESWLVAFNDYVERKGRKIQIVSTIVGVTRVTLKTPSDNPAEIASETSSGSADSTESSEIINVSSLEEDIRVVDGLLVELRRRKIIDESITGVEFLDSIEETPPLQTEESDSSESATSEDELEQALDIRNEIPLGADQVSQDDSHVESESDSRCKPIFEHKEALKSIDYLVQYLEEHEIDRKDLKYRLYLKGLRSEIARSQQQNQRQAKITWWASAS